MIASVDQSGCIGCGMCEQTAPEVFQLQGGTAQAISERCRRTAKRAAKEAASNCPRIGHPYRLSGGLRRQISAAMHYFLRNRMCFWGLQTGKPVI